MEEYKLKFELHCYPERTEEQQVIPNEIWYRDEDIRMLMEEKAIMLADIKYLIEDRKKMFDAIEAKKKKIIIP